MKHILTLILCMALAAGMLAGCGGGNTAATTTPQTGSKDSVVIAMGTTSEPEAGFDPAYGWGAGEHVHEPLIQSTLTVTNTDLTIGYDLANDVQVSDDGLTWTVKIRDDLKFTDAFGAAKGVDALVHFTDMVQGKKESSLVFPQGVKILVIAPIELGKGVDDNPGSTVCGKYKESTRFMEFYPIFCKNRGAELLNAAEFAQPSPIDNVHMSPESHKSLGLAVAAKIKEILG